jgi:hypothetical protein
MAELNPIPGVDHIRFADSGTIVAAAASGLDGLMRARDSLTIIAISLNHPF